jgi:hypothetical protein
MLDKLLSPGWYVMTNGTVVRVLFFILDEVFSVNTTCFVKTMDKPLSWFRFIDDVDMKWTESEENLNRFFDHANNATSCQRRL